MEHPSGGTKPRNRMIGPMDMKIYAAGLCVAVIAAAVIGVPPVEAQTKKKQVYTTQPVQLTDRERPDRLSGIPVPTN